MQPKEGGGGWGGGGEASVTHIKVNNVLLMSQFQIILLLLI